MPQSTRCVRSIEVFRTSFLLYLVVEGCLAGASTPAQELIDEVNVTVRVNRGEPGGVVVQGMLVTGGQSVLPATTFDRLAYGVLRNRGDQEKELMRQLRLRLSHLVATCRISSAQRQKLELAGRGDIDRLLGSVDALYDKYAQGPKLDDLSGLMRDIAPFQTKLQTGVFDDDSMYAKVLRASLTPNQQQALELDEQERRRDLYAARVSVTVAKLQDVVPMTEEERIELTDLILQMTPLPNKFCEADYFYVLAQLSTLDKVKLGRVLNEKQTEQLSKYLEKWTGMARNVCTRYGVKPISD